MDPFDPPESDSRITSDAYGITVGCNVEIFKNNVIYLHVAGTIFPQVAEWVFTVYTGSESFENDIAEGTVPCSK